MRTRYIFVFLSLFFSIITKAQEGSILTPNEKAYLFHTIRKSPILEQNIGRYIQYLGKKPTYPNGELNYDSTEYRIRNNPELLKIYFYDFRHAPKGIIAELTNKMALWELNIILQARRDNSLEKKGLTSKFDEFRALLIHQLPENALREKEGKIVLKKRIINLSNPELTFSDKVGILEHNRTWNNEQKMDVIRAYNTAINQWVANRSKQLYQILGGKASMYVNVLTAAGDGSNTSGVFEARERKENGWWNKGLPQAVGFFPYEPQVRELKNTKKRKKKTDIVPMGYTIHQFMTVGKGKETNIHLDVWGYNSKKQTTVVIEKDNKYYPLFGSKKSRFLSPDSAFGGGMTYYTIINRLKAESKALEYKISGKKGIQYWLEYYEKKKIKTKLNIEKSAMDLDNVRHTQYETNAKKLKYSKKRNNGVKHKDRDHRKDELILFEDDPVNNQRNKGQNSFMYYQNQLDNILHKIAKLKALKKKIEEQKHIIDVQIQKMVDKIGPANQWVPYTEEDEMYLYKDSARFDLMTQEFTFPARDTQVVFEVKLLPIPVSEKNLTQFDEVMLHINVMDAKPMYTAQINLQLNDNFAVNGYHLDTLQLLHKRDSIACEEFFDALYNKKKDFEIIVRGGGIGKWKDSTVQMNYDPQPLKNYPGKSSEERKISKELPAFKRLRTTQVYIQVNRSSLLEINSFTDPVVTNFKTKSEKITKEQLKYHLTGNQVLSAYRAYATLKKLRAELNVLAGKYLPREKAAKVIDRLNKAVYKTKITVGPISLKYKWFDE